MSFRVVLTLLLALVLWAAAVAERAEQFRIEDLPP